MVREAECARRFADVSVEAFLGAVYSSSGTRLFHAVANGDPAASATPWADGRREVTFFAPLDAPAVVRRMVGAEAVRVVDAQALRALPGGGVAVVSVPRPQFPGADKFETVVTVALRAAAGGVDAAAAVRCAAAGPFGLGATLEGFMASAALASLDAFFEFCARRVRELRDAGALEAAAAAAPRVPSEEDEFFDAPEPPAAWAGEGEGEGGGEEEVPLPLALAGGGSFEEAALLYLGYLCRTHEQSVALLAAIDARLARLEARDAAAAAAAARGRGGRPPGGAALAWRRAAAPRARRRALLAAGAAAAGVGAFLAWRAARRRGGGP